MKKTSLNSGRLRREYKTIGIMIDMYCNMNHGGMTLCRDCKELKDYAYERLKNCPFDDDKPVCADCTVHCYKLDMRQRVKDVMRFSGPRMLMKHPFLAVMHLIDEKIYAPIFLKKANQ